jgi:uncharacterized protein DUF5993
MMAFLFILYLIAIACMFRSRKKAVIFIVVINVMLSLAMLMYHATDVLKIRL